MSKIQNPTMAIRDSLLTSAAKPGPSEQILAELAALASWLSPKIQFRSNFLFFHHFWMYENHSNTDFVELSEFGNSFGGSWPTSIPLVMVGPW